MPDLDNLKSVDRIVIPKGTPLVWATSPRMENPPTHAKTTHTVTVKVIDVGRPNRIHWAGPGGYWRAVDITDALREANRAQ